MKTMLFCLFSALRSFCNNLHGRETVPKQKERLVPGWNNPEKHSPSGFKKILFSKI